MYKAVRARRPQWADRDEEPADRAPARGPRETLSGTRDLGEAQERCRRRPRFRRLIAASIWADCPTYGPLSEEYT